MKFTLGISSSKDLEKFYKKLTIVYGVGLAILLLILIISTLFLPQQSIETKNSLKHPPKSPPQNKTSQPVKIKVIDTSTNSKLTIVLDKIPEDLKGIKLLRGFGKIFVYNPQTKEFKEVVINSNGFTLINSSPPMNVGYKLKNPYLERFLRLSNAEKLYFVFQPAVVNYIKNFVETKYKNTVDTVAVSIKENGTLEIKPVERDKN